jgi:hypothetical protein
MGAGRSNASSAARPAESPTVEIAEVIERDVSICSEWIGTLDGLRRRGVDKLLSARDADRDRFRRRAYALSDTAERELSSVVQLSRVPGGGWQ